MSSGEISKKITVKVSVGTMAATDILLSSGSGMDVSRPTEIFPYSDPPRSVDCASNDLAWYLSRVSREHTDGL